VGRVTSFQEWRKRWEDEFVKFPGARYTSPS
jgi:hypothetical protein